DSRSQSVTKALQLTVNPPPFSISTNSPLPNATVGVVYSQVFLASGGLPPYRWSANSTPPGLTLDAAAGTLTGTPTARGPFSFTVSASDSAGGNTSKTFSLTVNPAALIITTESLFAGTVGVAYSQIFSASGGVPPYRWALTSGQPPAGLIFDSGT